MRAFVILLVAASALFACAAQLPPNQAAAEAMSHEQRIEALTRHLSARALASRVVGADGIASGLPDDEPDGVEIEFLIDVSTADGWRGAWSGVCQATILSVTTEPGANGPVLDDISSFGGLIRYGPLEQVDLPNLTPAERTARREACASIRDMTNVIEGANPVSLMQADRTLAAAADLLAAGALACDGDQACRGEDLTRLEGAQLTHVYGCYESVRPARLRAGPNETCISMQFQGAWDDQFELRAVGAEVDLPQDFTPTRAILYRSLSDD